MKKYNLVKLDPYLGMSGFKKWFLLFITLFFLCIFFFSSGVKSGFLKVVLIAVAIFSAVFIIIYGAFLLSRWTALKGGRWAKLHYPLLVVHARISGTFVTNPPLNSENDFILKGTPQHANYYLLANAYPNNSDEDIEILWQKASARTKKIDDLQIAQKYFLSKNPMLDKQTMTKLLEVVKESYTLNNPRFIIAEIVCQEYGEVERKKYLEALLSGKAR